MNIGTSDWLTTLRQAAQVTQYAYDADDHRVSITQGSGPNAQTTQLIVDANRTYAQVIAEREAQSGAVNALYTFGEDLLQLSRAGQGTFYHRVPLTDPLGAVRRLVDESGSVTDSYTFDAWGNLTTRTGMTPNPYKFQGEWQEVSSGLVYLRARWYDPRTGRFLSRDPYDGNNHLSITLNTYIYANADPSNNRDPSGQFVDTGGFLTSANVLGTMTRLAAPTYTRHLMRAAVGSILGASFAAILAAPTIAQTMLGECVLRERECDSPVPVLVYGDDVPEVRQHIRDAYASTRPYGGLDYKKPPHPRGWYYSVGGPCVRASGMQCDEFPFASTMQGGRANYEMGLVSLRMVSAADNAKAGGVFGAMVVACRLQPAPSASSRFVVVTMNSLPRSGWICSR